MNQNQDPRLWVGKSLAHVRPLDVIVFDTCQVLLHTKDGLLAVLCTQEERLVWDVGQNHDHDNPPCDCRGSKDGEDSLNSHVRFRNANVRKMELTFHDAME